MSSSIFFGGSLLAAIIAGAIALFAPCCISVMLPAYFASSFQNRRLLVAMTFLFAAGIATVILPIAMGASVLRQLLTSQHTAIYVTGGVLMLALAIYVLLGGQIHLPMPGRRAGGKTGMLSVYSLGIFSGVASSCCAPVLAGVIALSSVASSSWRASSGSPGMRSRRLGQDRTTTRNQKQQLEQSTRKKQNRDRRSPLSTRTACPAQGKKNRRIPKKAPCPASGVVRRRRVLRL